MSVNIYSLLGVEVFWKVQIQPDVAYESTYVKIRYMYIDVKKNNSIQSYMEALSLHNVSPILHWEDNTRFISMVGYKTVTSRVKNIDIPVCFIQEHFTMVCLFQNMKSIVLCQQICVPDHICVRLSELILSEWLGSGYTYTLILNTINS